MNIILEDIPLWYAGGKGPDINVEISYYNEGSQPDIGIGTGSTQFYPMGVNVFFNYSTFYVEKTGNNIMIIMPDGMQLLYTYDAGNYIPPPEHFNTLESSGPGFVLTMKNSKTKYYYTDPNHSKITSIEDKNGNAITFYYDGNYNLDYIEDANNRIVQVTTDGNGRITHIQDPISRTAMFAYDGGGYLTSITDMAGFESILTYGIVPAWTGSVAGTKKKLTAVQTPLHTTSIQYEIPATIGSTLPLYRITITNNYGDSQVYGYAPTYSDITPTTAISTVKDFNGNVTNYTIHRATNRIIQVVYPDIYSSDFYEYDQYGYRNKIIHGGHETSYVYDSLGNLLQETDPRNNVTEYTYDVNNNLETITDPMNRTTTIGYDGFNNISSITTPVNSQSFTYYSDGNLESYTNANNHTTTYDYDGYGYISTVNHPTGNPEGYVNDPVGRPTTTTIGGVSVVYEYDNLNQVTKVTFPDGNFLSYIYDFTNVAEFKYLDGISSFYTYDCDKNCLLSHANTPQGDVQYTYDANGNVLTISINGVITSYEYDNLDRNTKLINPDGTSRSFVYDELDNVILRTDENGNQTTFEYEYDLLTYTNYSDNTPDVEYVYNPNGELIEKIDGTGSSTYTYDDGGRLINVNGPTVDDNLVYTYDGLGNQLTMNNNGFNVTNTFDALNRLTDVVSNYASANYVYDANGNLTKKTNGNGSFSDFTYNSQRQITSLYNKKSNDEIVSGFDYTILNSAFVDQIVDHQGNVSSYEYDKAYQLIREKVINANGKTSWDNKFNYDNQGNHISISKNGVLDDYTYNMNNQLTSMTKTTIQVNGIVEGDSATHVYVENIKANSKYLGNNMIAFTANDIPLDQSKDSVQLYARVNEILATVGDSAKFECTAKTYARRFCKYLFVFGY